ncbi:protein FAR1-RELATED SEQUENCE 5-like [Alnus glutinosa]|uniref:protein FAR1-RELATED SEQUENCE 5-like n=1 Tax=Alnus glutinosa TaxID=3517 RepID=UPI002D77DB7C|nr:protein FAR1-RELATED SEQUENCE 5-like [Alnus glutinosa]
MIDVPNDDNLTDEDGLEFELDDKEDNEPQYKMIDMNDKVEEPKESMMFDSMEKVEDYYRKYGQQVGFGGYEQLIFGEKDCRNYIEKARELRLGKGGAQALRDYFNRMQKQNDGFYFVMDVDDDCRLRNVFWAHARSRAVSEFFGDIITFDTTYLTNRYDMPFAHFVDEGVIPTYQVIEVGVINRNKKDVSHCVYYNEENEEEVEVQCTCALFETRGILCRHAISVLLSKKVETLAPRFFLMRWRKDLRRTYTLFKSNYDNFGNNSDNKRYDNLSKNLEKLASLGSKGKHILHYGDERS